MIVDGKQLAEEILNNLKLSTKGTDPKVAPTMAIILVGANPTSLSYIRQKQKSAEKIGAITQLFQYPPNVSIETINSQLLALNLNPDIHGIIIQRPLPSSLRHSGIPNAVKECPESISINSAVSPSKDIDGFHPQSQYFSPVALAVLSALYFCHSKQNEESPNDTNHGNDNISIKNLNISNSLKIKNFKLKFFFEWLSTQKILLLGRGETGGKPIAKTLDKFNIKFNQAHSKTANTKDLLKQADIIISAVGIPNFITGNMIKKGAVCLGVGISIVDQKSKIKNQKLNFFGDFEGESISKVAGFYTPTPGGIGPLTVAFLIDNLIKSWKNN